MPDGDEVRRTAGALALAPLVIKLALALFAVAAAVAMALGKIGVVIGGSGLAAFVLYALVSSIVKNQRLRKAMRESERD